MFCVSVSVTNSNRFEWQLSEWKLTRPSVMWCFNRIPDLKSLAVTIIIIKMSMLIKWLTTLFKLSTFKAIINSFHTFIIFFLSLKKWHRNASRNIRWLWILNARHQYAKVVTFKITWFLEILVFFSSSRSGMFNAILF